MENTGVSTQVIKTSDRQLISYIENLNSAKNLQINYIRPAMDKYTKPAVKQGKTPKYIPKGSTKEIELLKNAWCVYFQCYNPSTEKLQTVRKTNGFNKIKDYHERLRLFTALRDSYEKLLSNGYNPFQDNTQLLKNTISLTIAESKEKYVLHLKHINTRKKTIQTYLSKLNYLINWHGADFKINQFTEAHIKDFFKKTKESNSWSDVTYNACKRILNAYFNFLIAEKYISENPIKSIRRITITTTSEVHSVIHDEDLEKLMKYLRANDSYGLFITQCLYYTSIRPKELRQLQIKHINLKSNTITIPASISKNKKTETISIDRSLRIELDKLNLQQYPKDYYLIGNSSSIIDSSPIGENTPYNRFVSALKGCGLLDKNYTLYSLKHTSNVKKYLAGWKLAEISKANRHSSISQTEIYLRDLTKYIDITEKEIPAI